MRIPALCLAVLLGGATAILEAAPPAPKPIHTNKPKFRIPFNFDAAEIQRLGAKEIQLFGSIDDGAHWQKLQVVSPQAGRFNFEANRDGEYWFTVRTLDAKNELHPADDELEAGLRVIVDTTPPQLELGLRQIAPGRVQLAWNANDPYLDLSRLRLEFIQQGQSEWQAVSVVPKASDQIEWDLPKGGRVAVRGTVSDFAGNIANAQQQASIVAAPPGAMQAPTPDLRGPVAGQRLRDQAAMPSVNPAVAAQDLTDNRSGNASHTSATFSSMQGKFTPVATRPMGTEPSAVSTRLDSRTRLVQARQFTIGYKLQDVGPSGVSNVELFITTDNGTTWWRYGEDKDKQSPFHVEVPKAGTYGFSILVRSGVGLADNPPQPGEKPAIVVIVDESKPQLEMLPLQQGRGDSLGRILIAWRANDEHFGDKPVTLSYAALKNGPWLPIVGPIENSGSYVWALGQGVPSKVYVRIEVRDLAGNTERAETAEPVFIDLARPTAQIVDIEPNVAPQH
jgi:hypothetical protein